MIQSICHEQWYPSISRLLHPICHEQWYPSISRLLHQTGFFFALFCFSSLPLPLEGFLFKKKKGKKKEETDECMTSFAQKRKKKERKGIRPIRHFLPSFFMKIKKKELAFLSPLQGRRSSSFLQQKTKKRKEKDGERDHHSFLIFPSGRHGYPSFLY